MERQQVDLNCDLGEGFGSWSFGEAPDAELMELVSSANIAAGFHAGDPDHMDRVARLAVRHSVGIGVHPGYRDLQGFGRRVIQATTDELLNDIVYQTGALREFARRHGALLQHLKPHGALYMQVANNAELASKLVDTIVSTSPELYLYCMHGSVASDIAQQKGLKTIHEFYADRDYDHTGSIVFARRMRALYPSEVAEKCVRACKTGKVSTVDGKEIPIVFNSICFHSDTPSALAIGKSIREALIAEGIEIVRADRLAQ